MIMNVHMTKFSDKCEASERLNGLSIVALNEWDVIDLKMNSLEKASSSDKFFACGRNCQ